MKRQLGFLITIAISPYLVHVPDYLGITHQIAYDRTNENYELQCPVVTCEITATPSSVQEGDRITLRVTQTGASNPIFSWSTTAGVLSSTNGPEVMLDTTGQEGSITASVNVSTDNKRGSEPCPGGSCSTQVVVYRSPTPAHPQPIGGGHSNPTHTGISFLVGGQNEESEYGLYSYLLLKRPTSTTARQRCLLTIRAFLQSIPRIRELQKYVARPNLNNTYILINEDAPQNPSAEWILENYNYTLSSVLLRNIDGAVGAGPYIVSSLATLSRESRLSGNYLNLNLSTVPARRDIINLWVKGFVSRASEKYSWHGEVGPQFTLQLRSYIATAVEGSKAISQAWPQAKKALATILSWKSN